VLGIDDFVDRVLAERTDDVLYLLSRARWA
jgi:hypothetical protein